MTILDLRRISRNYQDGDNIVQALTDVDLTVVAGEMVAIMGPSGSGKSTLLTIAGGLESATSGTVLVNGQDLSELGANGRAELRRKAIGYVFQDLNLLDALTAAENVSLPLELDGAKARHAKKVAINTLNQVGLVDKTGRFPPDLSGGERQRVAIARAIVGQDRKLVLADEPTGALDSVNGEQIMRLLRKACTEGAAAVVVTHDAQLAAWADRILFLRDGRSVDSTSSLETQLEDVGRL